MSFTGGAILIAVAVPVLFFVLVWVAVTAGRILWPEKPFPLIRKYKIGRYIAREPRRDDLIGAHQIRSRHRTFLKQQERSTPMYERGLPDSIPGTWKDDLWERRN